jgi:hypothetical protein
MRKNAKEWILTFQNGMHLGIKNPIMSFNFETRFWGSNLVQIRDSLNFWKFFKIG